MSIKSTLKTKNALAVELIARSFIKLELDSRVPTISDYEQEINVARGTIQNSIKMLVDKKAVVLESRGQLGTYIRKKDLTKLLDFAGVYFLIGVMPLPYSKTYEGLSSGLLETMENTLNIPVNMAYMRGAQRRIEMVLNGRYDFAIMSKYAADSYIEFNENIEIIKAFPSGSFLSGHVLMFANNNHTHIEDGMRVGIDNDSIDQAALTLQACEGKDVIFIQVSYNQLIDKLKNKEIDATVWNGDENTAKRPSIHTEPLNLINSDNTKAVIIIDKRRAELKTLINDLIKDDEVLQIQQAVISGEIVPSY